MFRACLKTLLPENHYFENHDITSKDSNIPICSSFEASSEPQTIDIQFTLFLNMLLGVYLNNDLDDEVYKNCDVNFVYQEIERLLGDFKTSQIASY